jgi:hypothetical protein
LNLLLRLGVHVPSEMASYINIAKTITKSKEYPYSICTKNLNDINSYPSDFYKYIISQNKTIYEQEKCLGLCYQRYIIDKCNCYDGDFPLPQNHQDYHLCLTLPDIFCDLSGFITFFSDGNKINELCSEDCPKECDTITYSKSLSIKTFPTKQFAELIGNDSKVKSIFPPGTNLSYEFVKANFLTVRIYYDKLSYTEITESEKLSPFNFLSVIGGTASLFLGISLLSFIELIEIIIEVFCIMLQTNINSINLK